LRGRETLYRTILDTSHEGAWLIDANALTIYVNRRMARSHRRDERR
jgi:PAS domain S-box-containing protein